MKQSETIDQDIIYNILKFYEDIGINFLINQFKNENKKELLAKIKDNTEKKVENFIINPKIFQKGLYRGC